MIDSLEPHVLCARGLHCARWRRFSCVGRMPWKQKRHRRTAVENWEFLLLTSVEDMKRISSSFHDHVFSKIPENTHVWQHDRSCPELGSLWSGSSSYFSAGEILLSHLDGFDRGGFGASGTASPTNTHTFHVTRPRPTSNWCSSGAADVRIRFVYPSYSRTVEQVHVDVLRRLHIFTKTPLFQEALSLWPLIFSLTVRFLFNLQLQTSKPANDLVFTRSWTFPYSQ